MNIQSRTARVSGSFDPSFGTEGIVDVRPPGNFTNDLTQLAFDERSRLVIFGAYQRLEPIADQMGATRLHADGQIDESFGDLEDGFLITPPHLAASRMSSLAFREGGFVATGLASASLPALSFDEDGRFIGDGSVVDEPQSSMPRVTVLPDGRWLLASSGRMGGRLYRRFPDGSQDEEFGESGRLTFLPDAFVMVNAIAATATGCYIGGAYGNDAFVGKCDGSGMPDASFGDAGFRTLRMQGAVYSDCRRLSVTRDGKILALLGSNMASVASCSLTRLHADGSTDESFNRGLPVTLPGEVAEGLAQDAEGRIVAALVDVTRGNTFIRLHVNGLRDTSFGVEGNGEVHVPFDVFRVKDAGIQSDGRIVAAGQYGSITRVIRLLP